MSASAITSASRRKKYKEALARGQRSELLVLTVLGRKSRPFWIVSVRKATQAEDQSGVDVIVETSDRGRLYLQVKSSGSGAKKWKNAHRGDTRPIGLVVVDGEDTNTIYGRVLAALILLREPSLRQATA